MKKAILFRRISQTIFLSIFIYVLWSTAYPLSGLISPESIFRLDPLIMFITSISERTILSGIGSAIAFIVLTLVLGRFFCGWICPLGTTINMVGALRKKHFSAGDEINRRLRVPKYLILLTAFICSFAGMQIIWFLDPIVIAARFVSLNLIPFVTVTVDNIFIALIKATGFYAPIQDLYRALRESFLGVSTRYFSHSLIILGLFLLVVGSSLVLKRVWCRSVCPLGALYALFARFSLLTRVVDKCVKCAKCKPDCPMGAIKDDMDYVRSECILCMKCIYECEPNLTKFTFPLKEIKNKAFAKIKGESGISRRDFLFLAAVSSLGLIGFKRKGIIWASSGVSIIRPPAALREDKFVDRCVRCGNCMKVCITNGLQPILFQSGLGGIWTPHLVPEIGYCEYHCTLCGNTCPTGAIPRLSLDRKKMTRLGIARIDQSICIPWSKKGDCIVCEEHCPIPEKAIKLIKENVDGRVLSKPYIDVLYCVGCGICQNKCPVRPSRAIKVSPETAKRT